MGNCLTSKRIVSHNSKNERQRKPDVVLMSKQTRSRRSEFEQSPAVEGGKRKRVRFEQCEEGTRGDKNGHGGSKSGVVRIRVVVTKEELKQIMNYGKDYCNKYSSVEDLVSAMRLRDRRIDEAGTIDDGTWKPDLESIPEDH